jgi:hypothetical protein
MSHWNRADVDTEVPGVGGLSSCTHCGKGLLCWLQSMATDQVNSGLPGSRQCLTLAYDILVRRWSCTPHHLHRGGVDYAFTMQFWS